MVRFLQCAVLFVSSAAMAADAGHGKQVFEICSTCHGDHGQGGETAPSLIGVIGRKAGSLEDFRYSPPMKRSGITWDEATLKNFVMNPQGVVKGTRMPFDGLRDEHDAEDVVAFVSTLK